ncbi:hypothetical protein [Streptomyces sp. NPDC097640]|uniref:hypothetical protein n=1 Tax=Streptomyces sp. NPDC097640 TaxID=3157229 RepID=UPI003330C6E4
MSGLIIPILTCDGTHNGEVCDAEYGGDPDVPSLAKLRETASAEGWMTGDDRDYCPGCKRRLR